MSDGVLCGNWNRGSVHRWSVWRGGEDGEIVHGLRTQLRSWVMDNRRRSVWKDTDPDKMKLTYPAMPQIPQHLEVLKKVHMSDVPSTTAQRKTSSICGMET